MASAITTGITSGTPTAPTNYGTATQLGAAIQEIWSKEILFEAMPILRFEQFAVKKTELGVQPGLTINFMRYNNLGDAATLTEGTKMETNAITASQFQITVLEQGYAIAVSELLLNASFDDVMASASRLLGRNMAKFLDESARNTIYDNATSVVYGRDYGSLESGTTRNNLAPYNSGAVATSRADLGGVAGELHVFAPAVVKDAVETLATKNVPRLGDTYVCFIHPHQSRNLRDWPEFFEVSKYAAPGNFMLGEIGRMYDVVFIETTQVHKVTGGAGVGYTADTDDNTGNGGEDRYDAVMLGDNAFGHAISLPVELRDGGILDFGREHALAWYAIWGFGLITDNSVVLAETQ